MEQFKYKCILVNIDVNVIKKHMCTLPKICEYPSKNIYVRCIFSSNSLEHMCPPSKNICAVAFYHQIHQNTIHFSNKVCTLRKHIHGFQNIYAQLRETYMHGFENIYERLQEHFCTPSGSLGASIDHLYHTVIHTIEPFL